MAYRRRDPLKIDRLLARSLIDEMQHCYALQLYTMWICANRPMFNGFNTMNDRRGGACPESSIIHRMTSEDQYFKTMSLLTRNEQIIIYSVVIEEKGVAETCARIGVSKNYARMELTHALDSLGDALVDMRKFKDDLEKTN
jgi:hypothetical protein